MAMREAVSLSEVIIDCSTIIIAIVICVVEEPVDDAAFAGVDESSALDSNDAVSPDVGQPKEVVAEFLVIPIFPDPEFAEPDQRRRERRR